MGAITLDIKYNKKEGLVISPSELIQMYLSGIPLCFPDGSTFPMEAIKHQIESATEEMEEFLSIKIKKQIVWETHDFIREEFFRWGYVKTVFPIMEPLTLEGHINNIKQVNYPKDWLSIKRGNDKTKFRNLYLIPNTKGGATMTDSAFVFSGITPHLGFFGTDFIPNYWRVKYCSGWDHVPVDLIDGIAQLASIQILSQIGDLIFGAGIGNQSISIDGISQSYSTTKGGGAGAFGGRVKQLVEGAEKNFAKLKAEYYGIRFNVL
jgi:hypothetical protein